MVKKRVALKKPIKKSKPIATKNTELERVLVQNFVSLQKVITNLSTKFDSLTLQLSKLLDLFEISAKTLAKKEFDLGKDHGDTKEIIKKIDNLLEQNKIIARGLTLMHKGDKTQEDFEENPMPIPEEPPRKLPAFEDSGAASVDINQYQKSISSPDTPTEFKRFSRA